MRYITTELIEAIKRNSAIPTSQAKFSNSDFLAFLNEELELTIVGELLSLRQDYFVSNSSTTLIASTSSYDIPTSAVGWKIESIGYLDSSSNYYPLPIITRDQRGSYDAISASTTPAAVYITGNTITTVPSLGASVSGSLQFDLVRIQNKLVLPGDTGLISVVADDGTDYTITVDTAPVATGDSVDIISGTNPFNIVARNVTATIVGVTVTITYGDDFSRDPVAGDYVCSTGETPVANIPEDFHPVLAQAATIRCLIANNDVKGLQTASLSLKNMFTRMGNRASKRVNSAPRKLVATNHALNLMRGR